MTSRLTLEDLVAIRHQSQPLTGTIAPTTCSEMFKSKGNAKKAKAKDFSHRLTLESRLREPATLKAARAELTAGVMSLATGRPSPEYYPVTNVSFGFAQTKICSGLTPGVMTATRAAEGIQGPDASAELPVAMSYGYSQGSEINVRFLTEHVELVHSPPYSNWEVCLNTGSTSAIEHVLRMFCSRGDYILTEEYTYSGALEAMKPLGLHASTIKMDNEGMSADELEMTLASWDSNERGAPKPFVLYTIPTGQNPTGVTQTSQRRKEIYAVAERHDLLIIEDDPYYYLHYPSNTQKHQVSGEDSAHNMYLHSLLPSYLSMDVSGRVMRLDSTSKIIAPGLRCSWMTANSDIIAKILSHHDVGVVCPSGPSQLMMGTLLEHTWGHKGFTGWLMYLRDEYAHRCQTLVQACEKHLPGDICSWQSPEAGMFLWIKIDWRKHALGLVGDGEPSAQDFHAIEDSIYKTALRKGTLVCKGSAFHGSNAPSREMFLRVTFATASLEDLGMAINRLDEAIRQEFCL